MATIRAGAGASRRGDASRLRCLSPRVAPGQEGGDMIVSATRLADARLVELEPQHDERGFFARIWCARELEAHGIATAIVQESLSYNRRAGTLRGLHYQKPPHAEAKIVRCVRAPIFDLILHTPPAPPPPAPLTA